MKKTLFIIITILMSLNIYGQNKNQIDFKSVIKSNNINNNIKWTSFEDLSKIKTPLKKKILIFFEKPNCPYCQEMKETTFKNKEVVSVINKNFYAIKFNYWSDENVFFNNKTYKSPNNFHEIFTYLVTPTKGNYYSPTTVILDENYNKIQQQPGKVETGQFMKILKRFAVSR